MNIAYCIASRGRHPELCAVIVAAWNLRSGKHAVSFHVACDDDEHTACERKLGDLVRAGIPIRMTWAPDRKGQGATWNRAAEPAFGADVVTLMSNRALPITQGWDAAIAAAVEKHPSRILWWCSPVCGNTTFPVISRLWMSVCGWKPCPDLFPYWWADTWLREVDAFVHGDAKPLFIGGAAYTFFDQHKTQELREPEFWNKVFGATRPQRLAEARAMLRGFQIETPLPAEIEDCRQQFELNDVWFAANHYRFTGDRAASTAPPDHYLQMRRRAAAIIAQHEAAAA